MPLLACHDEDPGVSDREVLQSLRPVAGGLLPRALAVISVAYCGAGVLWTMGGPGFPFGPEGDPLGHDQSLLGSVDQRTASPWVAALALLGATSAWGMLSRPRHRWWSALLIASALLQGLLYAVVIPDGRPLIAAAHVPVLVAAKPFGWPPDVTIGSQLPWPVVHQLVLMALGSAWFVAGLRSWRLARNGCPRCGRPNGRWADAGAARVWGRWAVGAAMVTPVLYASSRLAWALDIPYGVTDDFLVEMRADEPTIFVAGALMALLGLGGATLTVGLTAAWGERWPAWIPLLRRRRVPVGVAVVPGLVVAVLLVGAGKTWYWSASQGHLPEHVFGENWATVIYGAFLPFWGLSLAAATFAYWLRRRGRCTRCGAGA
jgi:hypothetical protein